MKYKKIAIFFIIFLFIGLTSIFGKEPIKVRVAVVKGVKEVTLSVSGYFDIIDGRTKLTLLRGKDLAASKVTPLNNSLKLKDKVFDTDVITIVSKKLAAIVINNRRYRGDVYIFREEDGTILVVNMLDLEFYIKGVLYHEISPKWPMEAIKAQAVAARTFAVYQKEVMKFKDYDLMADTSSQVYGGFESEKHKTNRAVNFTNGEILNFQGKVFPAFFHATCGGTTEDAGELWKIDSGPLKGGIVCSFCMDSPHYYWKAQFDLKTIQKKLGNAYQLTGVLKNLAVIDRSATGRVRTLVLTDDQGDDFNILAKDFRLMIGSDLIRSTNFSIVIDQDRVIFNGKGWGHGAGLCQWGAYGMSRTGSNYKQILEFYYPGSEIVTL